MQQITLVFWWHAHTNISSLQIFPLQRIEKNTQIPTNLYDIKQLHVRPVQHSYHGFVAVLWGFSAASLQNAHEVEDGKNDEEATWNRQIFDIFCGSSGWFLPVRPNKGPSKWTSLSKSFDDCIGGKNFYPQTFPWENNKMIHATTALPIGSVYEI